MRGLGKDSEDCISASCRYIHQAERISHQRASLILRQLPVRPSPTIFLQWRGKVSHASVLLHVRCGQHSLIACRLASSSDVDAQTSLLWTHAIIANVHRRHRRRMLETLAITKHVWGAKPKLNHHTCPYCHGHGHAIDDDDYYFSHKPHPATPSRYRHPCESCVGSGRLKPLILHTFHNKFVSPQADGTVKQAESPSALVLLEAIFMPDGRVAFRTVHDTFLTAMNAEANWEVRLHSKPQAVEEWEKFEAIACCCKGLLF